MTRFILGLFCLTCVFALADEHAPTLGRENSCRFAGVPLAAAADPYRHIIGDDSMLSGAWGQEMVGMDLAIQSLLTETDRSKVPVLVQDERVYPHQVTGLSREAREVAEAVYSTPSNDRQALQLARGTGHVNLITARKIGESYVGGGLDAEIVAILSPDFEESVLTEAAAKTKAKLIYFGYPHYGHSGIPKLVEDGIVVLPGATPPEIDAEKLARSPAIIVGDLGPLGAPSGTGPGVSPEGQPVIFAPGDEWLATVDGLEPGNRRMAEHRVRANSPAPYNVRPSIGDSPLTTSGGPEGAAALVTAALANVLSLVPDLSSGEATALLRKTATRTAAGVPMLNALKLVEVAKRLRGKSVEQRKRLIESDTRLFDFSAEAAAALEIAEELSGKKGCEKQALGFFRRAHLLQPENAETQKKLAAAYDASGLRASGDYFRLSDPTKRGEVLARHVADINPTLVAGTLRALPLLPPEKSAPLYEKAINDDTAGPAMVRRAAEGLSALGEPGRKALEAASSRGLPEAAMVLGDIGRLTEIATGADFSLNQQLRAIELARELGADGVPVLAAVMKSESSYHKEKALSAASSMGPHGESIALMGLDDDAPGIRERALLGLALRPSTAPAIRAWLDRIVSEGDAGDIAKAVNALGVLPRDMLGQVLADHWTALAKMTDPRVRDATSTLKARGYDPDAPVVASMGPGVPVTEPSEKPVDPVVAAKSDDIKLRRLALEAASESPPATRDQIIGMLLRARDLDRDFRIDLADEIAAIHRSEGGDLSALGEPLLKFLVGTERDGLVTDPEKRRALRQLKNRLYETLSRQ